MIYMSPEVKSAFDTLYEKGYLTKTEVERFQERKMREVAEQERNTARTKATDALIEYFKVMGFNPSAEDRKEVDAIFTEVEKMKTTVESMKTIEDPFAEFLKSIGAK